MAVRSELRVAMASVSAIGRTGKRALLQVGTAVWATYAASCCLGIFIKMQQEWWKQVAVEAEGAEVLQGAKVTGRYHRT